MRTFIIRSATPDDWETTWIVNAKNHKDAKHYVQTNEDWQEGETILSCCEFSNTQAGIVFLETKLIS